MHQTAFRLLLMHQWSTYFRTCVVYWSGATDLCEGLGIEFKLTQWLRNRLDGRVAGWLQNRLAGFPVFHSTKPARRFRSVEKWKTV